jgi:hypothetical protein
MQPLDIYSLSFFLKFYLPIYPSPTTIDFLIKYYKVQIVTPSLYNPKTFDLFPFPFPHFIVKNPSIVAIVLPPLNLF